MVGSLSQGRGFAPRRWLVLLALAALVGLVVSSANAVSAPAAEATYIVQLAEPPLALYGGGIAGLAPTMPAERGATRLNPASPASVAYLGHLASRQNAVKAAMDARARPLGLREVPLPRCVQRHGRPAHLERGRSASPAFRA